MPCKSPYGHCRVLIVNCRLSALRHAIGSIVGVDAEGGVDVLQIKTVFLRDSVHDIVEPTFFHVVRLRLELDDCVVGERIPVGVGERVELGRRDCRLKRIVCRGGSVDEERGRILRIVQSEQ